MKGVKALQFITFLNNYTLNVRDPDVDTISYYKFPLQPSMPAFCVHLDYESYIQFLGSNDSIALITPQFTKVIYCQMHWEVV